MHPSPRRAALLTAIAVVALTCTAGLAMAATKLSSYLLRDGQQPGFHVSGRRRSAPTVAAYVRSLGLTSKRAARAVTKLLTDAGYSGGVTEPLSGALGEKGFSLVNTFTKASGPAAGRTFLYDNALAVQKGEGTVTTFRVPGLRSARGVTAIDAGNATSNVYWIEGSCVLGSGLYLRDATNMTAAQVNAPVIKGIRSQHARMHGRCS